MSPPLTQCPHQGRVENKDDSQECFMSKIGFGSEYTIAVFVLSGLVSELLRGSRGFKRRTHVTRDLLQRAVCCSKVLIHARRASAANQRPQCWHGDSRVALSPLRAIYVQVSWGSD